VRPRWTQPTGEDKGACNAPLQGRGGFLRSALTSGRPRPKVGAAPRGHPGQAQGPAPTSPSLARKGLGVGSNPPPSVRRSALRAPSLDTTRARHRQGRGRMQCAPTRAGRISSQHPDLGRPRRRGNRGRDALAPRGRGARRVVQTHPRPPVGAHCVRPRWTQPARHRQGRGRMQCAPTRAGRISSQHPDLERPRRRGNRGRDALAPRGRGARRVVQTHPRPSVGAHCVRPCWTQATARPRQGAHAMRPYGRRGVDILRARRTVSYKGRLREGARTR
jgi:hypothetical protein